MTTWKKYFFGLKRSRIISFRQIFIILLWIYLAGRMGCCRTNMILIYSFKNAMKITFVHQHNNAFCIPNAFHASAVPQFMRNMPLYTSFAYHPLYSIVSSWTKINFLCNFLFHFDIDILNLYHSYHYAYTMKIFTEITKHL